MHSAQRACVGLRGFLRSNIMREPPPYAGPFCVDWLAGLAAELFVIREGDAEYTHLFGNLVGGK